MIGPANPASSRVRKSAGSGTSPWPKGKVVGPGGGAVGPLAVEAVVEMDLRQARETAPQGLLKGEGARLSGDHVAGVEAEREVEAFRQLQGELQRELDGLHRQRPGRQSGAVQERFHALRGLLLEPAHQRHAGHLRDPR